MGIVNLVAYFRLYNEFVPPAPIYIYVNGKRVTVFGCVEAIQ